MKTTLLTTMTALVLMTLTQARPRRSSWLSGGSSTDLWIPEPGQGSRDEWMRTHGMGSQEMERTSKKLDDIRLLLLSVYDDGAEEDEDGGSSRLEKGDSSVGNDGSSSGEVFGRVNNFLDVNDCVMLSEEQADEMLSELQRRMREKQAEADASSARRRHKRKLINFNANVWRKWDNFPIKYKFDGQHTSVEQQVVRGAVAHWEANTCVRFQEVDRNEIVTENHLLFTRENFGCKSFIGKVQYIPQQVNLQYNCLWEFGIPVHEIGHALGLWHEQQRADAPQYIRVNHQNLDFLAGQFRPQDTLHLGVPYDYDSVMHYKPQDGSDSGSLVMEAADPLYQSNMGQRVGLSFYDAKIINKAYCADVCMRFPLPRGCERDGYQDPNDCSRCKCPDGFGGRYCETVAPSVKADCSEDIELIPSEEVVIESPGYNQRGYKDRTECNWYVKAPAGHQVVLEFEGQFGMYCHYQEECYHWLEVKYQGDLSKPGPRFCCYETPQVALTSEGREMMLVLRANFSTNWHTVRDGFRLILRAEPANGGFESTTTTSTTTTTTTTTTAPPSIDEEGKLVWKCDFENAGRASLCGLTQEDNDEFDWTLHKGKTPSDETGPESAFTGLWYAYIEASKPRQRGDRAGLVSPKMHAKGSHCVSFRYHMFGFHINQLRVFHLSQSVTTFIWQRKGQQATKWLHAMVDVNLRPNDQFGFLGVRGGEFSGDIAIDDIQVRAGVC